jgi:hypothetical protein
LAAAKAATTATGAPRAITIARTLTERRPASTHHTPATAAACPARSSSTTSTLPRPAATSRTSGPAATDASNAQRLEAALAAAGISYEHRKELAPTTELRQVQYREDDRAGVGKRSRAGLAPEYVERYESEILGEVDLGPLVDGLPADGASALMCVERDPEACHRSLVAQRLASEFGLPVTHLRPA